MSVCRRARVGWLVIWLLVPCAQAAPIPVKNHSGVFVRLVAEHSAGKRHEVRLEKGQTRNLEVALAGEYVLSVYDAAGQRVILGPGPYNLKELLVRHPQMSIDIDPSFVGVRRKGVVSVEVRVDLNEASVERSSPAPRLGALMEDFVFLDNNARWVNAVRIVRIEPGSPAARAFLKPGDIVTVVNGRRVQTFQEVRSLISTSKGTVSMRIIDGVSGMLVDLAPIDVRAR